MHADLRLLQQRGKCPHDRAPAVLLRIERPARARGGYDSAHDENFVTPGFRGHRCALSDEIGGSTSAASPTTAGQRRGSDREGASVFYRDEAGQVFHTYSTYARGIDLLNTTYNFLDLTPKGRDEDHLSAPQAWVRYHDRYGPTPVHT